MNEGISLNTDVSVKTLYGIDYAEGAKDLRFDEGKSSFYRLLYIDKGGLTVFADGKQLSLQSGECCFFEPGMRCGAGCDENAGGIIMISFDSTAAVLPPNRVFALTNGEKRILGNIIKESKTAFSSSLKNGLVRRAGAKADCEQMISLLLPQLLISIKRNMQKQGMSRSNLKESYDDDIISSVLKFLNENCGEKLRFKDVTDFAKISATALKTLFAKKTGCGVMEYFTDLKINRAKRLISESNYNFTEISRLLGYDSLHYFSRQFKQKTGMSPTEYANSARIYIDTTE